MKRKTLVTAFSAFLPVAVVLRILEMIKCIDPANGFFYSSSSGENFLTLLISRDNTAGEEVWLSAADVMNISLAVMMLYVVLAFVLSVLSKDRKELHAPPVKSLPLGICSILTGVGLLADICIKINTDIVYNITLYGKAENQTVIYLLCIFGALAAAAVFYQGYRFIKGQGPSAGLYVLTVIWALFRLFIRYTLEFNGKALISENILDIFALCAIMMTLLYLAHAYYRVKPQKTGTALFGFGLCAAFFGLLSSLPRIYFYLAGNTEPLSHSAPPSFFNLLFSVFIIIFLFSMCSKKTVADADFFEEQKEQGKREEYTPMLDSSDETEETFKSRDDTRTFNIPLDESEGDLRYKKETCGEGEEPALEEKAQDKNTASEKAQGEKPAFSENSSTPQETGISGDDPFAGFSVDSIMAEIEKRGSEEK